MRIYTSIRLQYRNRHNAYAHKILYLLADRSYTHVAELEQNDLCAVHTCIYSPVDFAAYLWFMNPNRIIER